MSSLQTLSIFVAVLFVTSVVSQQPIVSVQEIEDGGTFSVTCDVSRMSSTRIPSAVTNIISLEIKRQTSQDASPVRLAQYFPLSSTNPQFQNIPPGRQWTVDFTGGNSGSNNKNTIKVVILVSDAECADAGLYHCDIQYEDPAGGFQPVTRQENVTAKAGVDAMTLTTFPFNAVAGQPDYSQHHEGDNVTLTCRIDGPQELHMKWQQGSKVAFINDIQITDYPYPNDITTSAPSLITSGACNKYEHRSVLNLGSLSQDNDGIMYLCVVMENNNFGAPEVASANMTIGITSRITTPNPGPATAGGGGDEDLGMILGIVFGLLALIVIIVLIVYFCWWRKRGKSDKYGDKEMDEPQTDPNFNAPPPVFYSKPSKHKDEKDNAAPAENGSHDKPRYDDYGYDKEGQPYDRKPYYDNHYDDDRDRPRGRDDRDQPRGGDDRDQPRGRRGRNNSQGYAPKADELRQAFDKRQSRDGPHYASTDISRSEEESDAPLDEGRSKPRSKPKPQPKRRSHVSHDEDKQAERPLHYAELDLNPRDPRRRDRDDGDRRREQEVPIQYAEIRV